jgi:hypothetical protein
MINATKCNQIIRGRCEMKFPGITSKRNMRQTCELVFIKDTCICKYSFIFLERYWKKKLREVFENPLLRFYKLKIKIKQREYFLVAK